MDEILNLRDIVTHYRAKAQKALDLCEVEDNPDPDTVRKNRNRVEKADRAMEYINYLMRPLEGTYDPWRDPDWRRSK